MNRQHGPVTDRYVSLAFLDLHSHVLPALDDGAPDATASMAMLRGLAELGFGTVYATPHQKAGQFLPPWPTCRARWEETRRTLADAGVGLDLRLGAENMWDDVFYARAHGEAPGIPCYDDGRAFLVELPLGDGLPIGLFDQMFSFRLEGKLPVLAHPERYAPLWKDMSAVERLRESCALVVDLGAVAGRHGRKQRKAARAFVAEGLAHAAASDAHSPNDVRVAAEGIAWIRKKLGARAIEQLLDVNPRRIVAGEHPE